MGPTFFKCFLFVVCVRESKLISVRDAVLCLPAAELKTLAKSLQISCSSLKKHNIADAIVKHSQRTNVTNFFACSSDTTEKMVLKRFEFFNVMLLNDRCKVVDL